MKNIRNILLIITIIFGLIMQAEVYQDMLWRFSGAYYLSSQYTVDKDNLDSFIEEAQGTADKYGVHVFSVFSERKSNFQTTLHIYGNDTVIRDSLKKTMDIDEKTYTALIGGITTVEFEDFDEVKNTGNGYNLMVSYIGNDDDITAAYQDLKENYSLTEPDFWEATENDMMIIVWGMVAILMIVLNVVEVIRRQKEIVIRASLGESTGAIALKSAISDIITYAILFALAKLLMSQFISGQYAEKVVLTVYCIGAVISVVPYIVFTRFDVRKAFANASDRKGMFYMLNILKIVATALTIFTIATNLSSIQGNLLASSDVLEKHYDGYYFGVMTLDSPTEEEYGDAESVERKYWDDLYEKEYDTLNPVVCVGSQIGDMGNYIFVNHNAKDMLQGFSDKLTDENEKADFVVFVPEGSDAEMYKEEAKNEVKSIVREPENIDIAYEEYSNREKFYYINSNREDFVDGLACVTNPIIMYQANEEILLNGGRIVTESFNGAVIYDCSENVIRETSEKYEKDLGTHYLMFTNVKEDYTYSHNFLVKLITFISSLCILVLLLDIAIIMSQVKMEFRLKSMEISLKKVLGYTFFERHKGFIITNLAQNIIVILAVCVASIFVYNTSLVVTLTIGVVLTLVEFAIIVANVVWVERTNISKSLKGGCL